MKTSVLITALICITFLEGFALYLGYDGILLTAVIAVIAAIAGVIIPTPSFLNDLKGGKNGQRKN